MKHTLKITITLIAMFLATQLIGLYVVHSYTPVIEQQVINGELQNITINPLPYGMEPPEIKPVDALKSIILAFVIAILLIVALMKFKAEMFIRIWFFIVVILAIGIAVNGIAISPLITIFNTLYTQYIAAAIALPLAIFKIFKRNIMVHNATELLIYPGIAAVFVPILNIWTVFILLILISIYDMWAVWHSGFMQKMAKYQMNNLKIFTGFFVPYMGKKLREKMKKIKMSKGKMKNMKVRVNVAILGGGDVVFPIITAGVLLRISGLIPALMITIFATIALLFLLVYSQKGKFYPAMPFITAGCVVGLLVGFLF